MGMRSAITEALRLPTPEHVAGLERRVEIAESNAELAERRLAESVPLQESVADLERALLTDPGWRRFTALTDQEFTDEGRAQIRAVCRLMAVANPLIKRGLSLRSAYVWGGGVEIAARANGKSAGEQDVQAVVAGFLTDDANARAATGPEACDRLEKALGTDGEVFLAHFTKPLSGQVQVRVILAEEISEVICNPEDRSEPWYYRRRWVEHSYTADGSPVVEQRERLYPDLDYRPRTRPKRIGTVEIAWDAPVLHVAVNRPEGWQRGVPDAYAAVNWARAYKEFLEQWATLMRSLARFAWKLSTKGSNRVQAKTALATAASRDPATGAALDVAGTAIVPLDATLDAIPKTGAVIDADSGRPLATMVASALDVPVTMLLSDPGQTGARAVAETLDQPTELAMGQRRDLWASVRRRQLRYVILAAVRAPRGELQGTVRWDTARDREVIELAGDTTDVIDVNWPDLDDTDVAVVVEAIKKAADTGVVPPEQILRLLLAALGVRDVDGLVDAMVDEEGRFLWPDGPPLGGGVGRAAVDAGRAGDDPADVAEGGRIGLDVGEDPGADPDGAEADQ